MKNKLFIFLLLFVGIFFIGTNNISTDASTTIKAGIVDTSGSRLNVRTSASLSSTIKTQVNDKSYVTIHNTNGNFYYVEYKDNTYGYVHKNYVDIISSNVKVVDTNWAKLNVRYGPGTNYYSFDQIHHNDKVIVLRTSGNWSNILYDGNEVGYVSSSYLSNTTSNLAYPKISLNVVSLKQYDSRWANIKLGASGGTIKQIGCLTTALSMTESYRKGYTVTPNEFAKTASYTNTGLLYWPSNYTQSTSTSYLTNIYNQLKIGKPVVIGAKTNNGGQHWVVVTGYKGGNTLSSSNFTINDPGSSTRDTLDDFFNAYPIFYKIAYYK